MDIIENKINELPEIYQKIYGYPTYDNKTSRRCDDRLMLIKKIVKDYQTKTHKRKIKILDIGCAQGYYALNLSEAGCDVHGIDYLDKNVDLCTELAKKHKLDAAFSIESLSEEFVDNIPDNQYDIILILSVIHHIAHAFSFDYAKRIMAKLADKAALVITELAVKEEPLYWNDHLPAYYTDWFEDVKFSDVLMQTETHLSDIHRPVCLYSNKFVYMNNNFYKIDEYLKSAYQHKPRDPSRCYFLSGDKLIKYIGKKAIPACFREIHAEEQFIRQYQDKFSFLPRFIESDVNEFREIYCYQINKGKLLLDIIYENRLQEYRIDDILQGVLFNLIDLENAGYFHGDLRIWNVCVDKDGKGFIIDFGNIQQDVTDYTACGMLGQRASDKIITVYDAFGSLVFDILTQNIYPVIRDYSYYELSCDWTDIREIDIRYWNFIRHYVLMSGNDMTYQKIYDLFDTYVLKARPAHFSEAEEMLIRLKLLERKCFHMAKNTDVHVLKCENEKINVIHKGIERQVQVLEEIHNAFVTQCHEDMRMQKEAYDALIAQCRNELTEQMQVQKRMYDVLVDHYNNELFELRHRLKENENKVSIVLYSKKQKGSGIRHNVLGVPVFIKKRKNGRIKYKVLGLPILTIYEKSNEKISYYSFGIRLLEVIKK